MERLGTKDRHERENEEAERLVRPAPKVKPPRHDRRRERMEVDDDADDDKPDKDLSKNYKVIGGSGPKKDLISVRLKDDPSKVVQVSEDTLRENPSKYELVEDSEDEQKPAAPKSEEKPEPAGDEKPADTSKADGDAQAAFRELAQSNPKVEAFLKDFTNPKSEMWPGMLEGNPTYPLDRLLPGVTLPEGVKTIKDLHRVMSIKAPAKAPKGKPKSDPPAESATPPDSSPPAASGGSPPEEPPAKKPPSGSGKKPPPEQPTGQPTRRPSKAEIAAAKELIISTFPAERAADLLVSRPPIHPDEVNDLVADYHLARSIPVPEKVDEMRDKISQFYATDPAKVKPPRLVRQKDGSEVELGTLSPEEQAQATRRHQLRTVAMSLAAQSAITKSLIEHAKAPQALADQLSDFMLSGRNEKPESRQKRAAQEAESLFYKRLEETKPEPVSDDTVKKVLRATSDNAAKQLAVGYFQANDYHDARKRFLDPKSEDHISERQPPEDIAAGLIKASKFLRKQGARYPKAAVVQDTAQTFRTRVLRHLATVVPDDKMAKVQDLLDVEDHKDYDRALDRHKQDLKAYKKQQKNAETQAAKLYEGYSKQLKEGGGKDIEPPPGSKDLLATWGVAEPPLPTKPPRYDLSKNPKALKDSAKALWDEFTSRQAGDRTLEARVVVRYLFGPFFTYPDAPAMGHDRQAVYLGVEPTEQGPYVGWEQPQARDLGDRDFTRLLTAAREWLRMPVLASNIEGVVRDTQLRAALDLAISAEGYGSALHPTLYNNLLARLAGEPQDETLLTVRNSKTARTTMPKDTVELKQAQADHFIARLDRLAATIQDNHEAWGMKFAAAKDLVQAIDKLADEFEKNAYGENSLTIRQAEVLKTAEVIQRDSDEKYMDTFKSPSKPIQTEADEPYMRAYADDDTSGVIKGKAENGRPLAP